MSAEGSPEPIDFDFFDEDDNRSKSKSREKSPAGTTGRDNTSRNDKYGQQDYTSGGSRPDSVRSTTSSLSVKIPTGGSSRERRQRYSSDEEDDDYSPKGVNGFDKSYRKKGKNSDRSRSDSGGSSASGPSKSTRPKSPRARHGSGSSSASYSSSLDSKSGDSDSSSSDSVTDVSPMQSPTNSRSPSPPRLQYNHDEINSSPEKRSKRLASKDSVRFREPSPEGGCVRPPPGSKKNTRLAESEAQELSMLLRAVLEMEDTPQRPGFQDFEPPRLHRPSSGKRPMSGKAMPHQRMNMSFSNDEVRRIDKDNQRLLQNIMSPPSSVPKPEKKRPSSGRMRTRSASYGSIHSRPASGHISHSALLRQRDQRRIEMENMKILKRIEGAKPTSELQSNKLKKDFNKQQQYAAQVSKAPGRVRPSSARRADFTDSRGMSKASSMQSLRSDFSHASSSTATSSRIRSRPSSAKYGPGTPASRPSWDDRFAY